MINEIRTEQPTWEEVRGYLDATKDAIDHGTTGVAEGLWLAVDALHTLLEPPEGLPARLMDAIHKVGDELDWQVDKLIWRSPDYDYLAQLVFSLVNDRWTADLRYFPDDAPHVLVMDGEYSTLDAAKAAVAEALRRHRAEQAS